MMRCQGCENPIWFPRAKICDRDQCRIDFVRCQGPIGCRYEGPRRRSGERFACLRHRAPVAIEPLPKLGELDGSDLSGRGSPVTGPMRLIRSLLVRRVPSGGAETAASIFYSPRMW